MLPDNVLSTRPVPATFSGARGLPVTHKIDFEDGGIAFNDPSRGHLYQTWRGRIIGDDVVIDSPSLPETVVYTQPGIEELSFTFDQNMRLCLAFVVAGQAYLRWYDSAEQQQVIAALDPGVKNPRVTLDDKRQTQTGISDIILAYLRDGALYYRQQRDRFQIEIDPTAEMPEEEREATRAKVATSSGLIKIGMNRQLRLQFMLAYGE